MCASASNDSRPPSRASADRVATRCQLSLFVPLPIGAEMDAIRRITDPVQHRLIPAHVTLCREDELSGFGLADLEQRLGHGQHGPITLQFGAPERFGGHGILLPCIDGAAAFQSLRAVVLAARAVRIHEPHITLAHPRNPQAPGNDLDRAASLREGRRVTFGEVHLIEQIDGAPWVVRGAVSLLAATG